LFGSCIGQEGVEVFFDDCEIYEGEGAVDVADEGAEREVVGAEGEDEGGEGEGGAGALEVEGCEGCEVGAGGLGFVNVWLHFEDRGVAYLASCEFLGGAEVGLGIVDEPFGGVVAVDYVQSAIALLKEGLES